MCWGKPRCLLFNEQQLREGSVPKKRRIADDTVLVVDDDPAVLRSIQRLLKAHGMDSRVFSSAEAFTDAPNSNDGLCLVVDIDLNGRSGIELSRQLAASGSSLPIIFITGNNADHVRKQATEAGCLAFLPKPFAAQSLLGAIEKAKALRRK